MRLTVRFPNPIASTSRLLFEIEIVLGKMVNGFVLLREPNKRNALETARYAMLPLGRPKKVDQHIYAYVGPLNE